MSFKSLIKILPNRSLSPSELFDLIHNSKALSYHKMTKAVHDYTLFIEKQSELRMFVRCDEDGNVLSDPSESGLYSVNAGGWEKDNKQYQKAKERVLFEDASTLTYERIIRNKRPIHWLHGEKVTKY